MPEAKDSTVSGQPGLGKSAGNHDAKRIHGYSATSAGGVTLAALGIVFGDIGTSPLYTLKTVLALVGGKADASVVLGVLSLLVWTLVIVTTLKYVVLAMSIANDGEGGILALMSLVGAKKHRPALVAIGLFGAALIYGDGAVTPAISVLSALEGLGMATTAVGPYVLPAAVVILLGLFCAQPLGTERIGKAFGPIMALWFAAIAAMGIGGLIQHPAILVAINPLYAVQFLATHGLTGFLVLGGVFLCVTGAEALYADMGHFGPTPIRVAWLALVFPSLILNYAGQAAIVLDGAPTDGNIFFRLCPGALLIPLVILATLATIIASQAIITGAFSMTRQAIQLGWLPRVAIKQTSAEGYGQIYVGPVNWILMVVTVGLTLGFRKSDNLASAYGIAVSLTMALTTVLLFVAMREVLRWPAAVAAIVAALFLVVDVAFFGANLVKIADGGYVPLLIAVTVYGVMALWHRGATAVRHRLGEDSVPLADINAQTIARKTPRVPGTAVFLTRTDSDTPPVLIWHLTHNKALHEKLLVLTVKTASTPYIAPEQRVEIEQIAPNFWRAEATFGFMDDLDIPALLAAADRHGYTLDLDDVTYYVGRASVVPRGDDTGLPRWQEALYAAMDRNATHGGEMLNLPGDRTVELGRQVAI